MYIIPKTCFATLSKIDGSDLKKFRAIRAQEIKFKIIRLKIMSNEFMQP